ncbi:hypothetical protein ACWGXJ_26015 [Paenibacillus sp. S33]|uniref:hypothetical protein n=1 Tax=Paenibacillus TaxID=44249 RepID=UPI0020B656DF|nr:MULTISPECIES: hypothetical protein [Paenibacillus]MCP3746654.1 hypothetical protein [Paenibacillus sp. A3M_27_13]
MDEMSKMSDRLSQEFKQDPLYKLITKTDLLDELFDDYIEDLNESVDYTTTEFEGWYCTQEQAVNFLCKPSTMRSWQKQLNHYIEGRMSGRTVIMDYQAVFRLKMALLLRKHQNIKLNRCAEMVGIVSNDSLRILDNYEDERRTSQESGVVNPFASASEEQMQKMSEWIAGIVDKRMEEMRMLALPGEDRMNELQEKVEGIADVLTQLQSSVNSEEQQEILDKAVSKMREDVETRDKIVMEQLSMIQKEQKSKQEIQQEIVNSLPWFVRMFVKKDK